MAGFLLLVPMMELNKKRLYQVEHVLRPFPQKDVRMVDHDHQTGVPKRESDQIIQEFDPWKPAVRHVRKFQCSTERVGDSCGRAPAIHIVPVYTFHALPDGCFNDLFLRTVEFLGPHEVNAARQGLVQKLICTHVRQLSVKGYP
jgi:hypothetical protein